MVVLSAPVCHLLADLAIGQSALDPSEHEYLVGIAMAVRDFSLGNDAAALPIGEDYRTAMTPDALYHLLDVRVVFVLSELACGFVGVALLVLAIIAVKRAGGGVLARPLIIGGAIPLAMALILGIAIAVDFSAFFVWLHGLFFADGTWTFPADSLLIRALPFEFWVSCAVVWAGSMALFCLISIGSGAVLERRYAPSSSQPASQE